MSDGEEPVLTVEILDDGRARCAHCGHTEVNASVMRNNGHDCDADDGELDGVETDWVANCHLGYGFGYSKEQALAEMAGHAERLRYLEDDQTVSVMLVEHVGNVTLTPGGFRAVEEFVSGERRDMPVEKLQALKDEQLDVVGLTSTLTGGEPDEEIEL